MPKEKVKNELTAKKIEKTVGIKRINPENLKPIYVNDFIVTHSEHEFFFTFSIMEPFQIESEEDLNNIEIIEAIARVKLALTPDFTKRVFGALKNNIESREERFEKNDKQNEPKPE